METLLALSLIRLRTSVLCYMDAARNGHITGGEDFDMRPNARALRDYPVPQVSMEVEEVRERVRQLRSIPMDQTDRLIDASQVVIGRIDVLCDKLLQ
jgi:hypothetical protein